MDQKEILVRKVKKYLNEYNNMAAYMEINEKEIEDCESRLASLTGSPKAPVYSLTPKGGNSNSGQPESECLEKERLTDRIKELEGKNYDIWLKMCRVDRAIEKLKETDRKIVEGKYKNKQTWEEIAEILKSGVNYCRRHHDKAIYQMASIMFGPTAT